MPNTFAVGDLAFIVGDCARALYHPDATAAVSMIPPYGTQVEIVDCQHPWIKIRCFGKAAWCLSENVSRRLLEQVESGQVGVTAPNGNFIGYVQKRPATQMRVEIGPRGGLYVRTASGFRRYL